MSYLSEVDLGLVDRLHDKSFRKKFFKIVAQESIASQIRFLREMRNMRQQDLAKETGMKQSAVSRIEKADYSSWTFNTLMRVGEALDARVRVVIEPYEEVIKDLQGKNGGALSLVSSSNRYEQPSKPSTESNLGLGLLSQFNYGQEAIRA